MAFVNTNGALRDEDNSESLDITPRTRVASYLLKQFENRTMDLSIEWDYEMRRYMQEVVPGLFLGPYRAASRSNMQTLLERGITHIVCVRQDIEAKIIKPNFPDVFKYLILDIADTATENIIQHFPKVKNFITCALSSGGQVLVHGNAGISRSPALVLAFVMETYGLSLEEAFAMVIQKRYCINPNTGFMSQLREYEAIYQAQMLLGNGQQSSVQAGSKRSIHQLYTDRLEEESIE